MDYNVAILITTFLRDSLLFSTIQSIVNNYPKNSIVLIADQGYASEEKEKRIKYFKAQIPLEYYRIPFDSGLSFGRNFLIQKAHEKNIPYTLISADSIQFTGEYDFSPIIEFLEQNEKRGLVGFELNGSKCPWEWKIEITLNGIKLFSSTEFIEENGITYKKCDICRNIFLAKTKSLLNLYDEEQKLCEHELAFIEYKKRGHEIYWTDNLTFKRHSPRNSTEYETYRKRLGDFQKSMRQKLGISSWVIYSPEARQEINEYKRRSNVKR